ncbi:hypothetical protein HYQ46_006557 [Verticillium longisporum]|nr:hypothetical protein HYQ46_006557 [Verticillium longisporum]
MPPIAREDIAVVRPIYVGIVTRDSSRATAVSWRESDDVVTLRDFVDQWAVIGGRTRGQSRKGGVDVGASVSSWEYGSAREESSRR